MNPPGSHPVRTAMFRIFWGIDAIVAAIAIYFFFVGLADGSVSSFNIGLWFVILVALAAALGGGLALHRSGRQPAALVLVTLLAIPAIVAGLFVLLVVITNPRWN
jgi:hypothetical protein